MLRVSSTIYQPNLFGTDLLMQLNANDSLLKLASAIPWQELEDAVRYYELEYSGLGSKFKEEVRKAVLRITAYPQAW